MEKMVNELYSFYTNKRILITGDTGFKGSWLSIMLKNWGAEIFGYSLEAENKYDNYNSCLLKNKIKHKTGDIRDQKRFRRYINEIKPDLIFHLAAQPLVLKSYKEPFDTFETNIIGTINLLEAIRESSFCKAVLIITTDKCYRNNEEAIAFKEEDALGGKDPYSASKACTEIATQAYIDSFFQITNSANIATARAGNVIGGGDWSENRIVPDIFKTIEKQSSLEIRNPSSVRPWQFVLEPLYGYALLMYNLYQNKSFQGAWNFGPNPNDVFSVLDLVKTIQKYCDLNYHIAQDHSKPHEAKILKLDINKACNLLSWKPILNFAQTVEFTVLGYQEELSNKHQGDLYKSRSRQIEKYLELNSHPTSSQ